MPFNVRKLTPNRLSADDVVEVVPDAVCRGLISMPGRRTVTIDDTVYVALLERGWFRRLGEPPTLPFGEFLRLVAEAAQFERGPELLTRATVLSPDSAGMLFFRVNLAARTCACDVRPDRVPNWLLRIDNWLSGRWGRLYQGPVLSCFSTPRRELALIRYRLAGFRRLRRADRG